MRAVTVLSATVIVASVTAIAPGMVTTDSATATETPRETCLEIHGEGTEKTLDPPTWNADHEMYEIETASQLVYLSENFDTFVSGSSGPQWREQDFVQTADIELDGCIFTPIGTRVVEDNELIYLGFVGTFDGARFAISGFYTDHTTSTDSVRILGLFGVIGEPQTGVGTVKNVTLVEAVVFSDFYALAGLLAGQNFGTVRESSAKGSVTVTESTASIVGGLVGGNQGFVRRSYSDATVNSAGHAGGLVGLLGFGSITDSYALGTVSGTNFVGGLSGNLGDDSSISISFSRAVVTGQSVNTGGLVGRVGNRNSLTDSFWDTTINPGLGSPAGTGKTTSELQSLSTFVNTEIEGLDTPWPIVDRWQPFDLDRNKVWGIRSDLNDGYPFLLWEYGLDRPVCPEPNAEGVYQVADVLHLAAVGSGDEMGPCGDSDNYVQVADIDLADLGEWNPLGTGTFEVFSGHYDGGGLSIQNMTVTTQGTVTFEGGRFSESMGGLFASLYDATIENLTIDNAIVTVADNVPETGTELGLGTIRQSVFGGGILAGSAVSSVIDNVHVSGGLDTLDTVAGGLIGVIGPNDFDPDAVTEISSCSVDVSMTTVDDAEIFLGGIVGALIGANTNVTISDCDVSADVAVSTPREYQFATVFEEFDQTGFSATAVGGVVGGSDEGSTLVVSDVTTSANSSIDVSVTEQGDTLTAAVFLGGVVGLAAGSLEISNSTVGAVTYADTPAHADQASLHFDGPLSTGAIGGLVGISGGGESTTKDITDSSAATRMSVNITAGDEEVAIGGLLGWTFSTSIERSSAALTLDLTTNDGSMLTVGGVVGKSQQGPTDTTVFRHSSATGSITTSHTGTLGELVAGGIAGKIDGSAIVEDLWSGVDISVDAEDVVNPPNQFDPDDPSGGAVVGGAFGGLIAPGSGLGLLSDGSPPQPLVVENILSRGKITTIWPTVNPDNFLGLHGDFAGAIEDPDQTLALEGNFAVANDQIDLVYSGPSVGISPLSSTQLTTITPFADAGWDIVPTSAGALPQGPTDEVWGMFTSGKCAPYLWWQINDVQNSCVDDTTDLGDQIETVTGPTTTENTAGASRPKLPGTETAVVVPPASAVSPPQTSTGSGGLPSDSDSTGDSPDASGDTEPSDSPDAASDEQSQAVGSGSTESRTGWLWAIGLAGLAAAIVLAGGMAFFRSRT